MSLNPTKKKKKAGKKTTTRRFQENFIQIRKKKKKHMRKHKQPNLTNHSSRLIKCARTGVINSILP